MRSVIYAATKSGYCVQVIDGGEVAHEYSAGNHQMESQTVVDPRSPNAVRLSQLKRWAKQTANEIAKEWRIPAKMIEYDPDLEAALQENFCLNERTE
jgi:predicted secreted hydrolase